MVRMRCSLDVAAISITFQAIQRFTITHIKINSIMIYVGKFTEEEVRKGLDKKGSRGEKGRKWFEIR